MLFKYKAIDQKGGSRGGEVEAPDKNSAISALQRRGLIVTSIEDEKSRKSIWDLTFFERVPPKDIVIMSREISTLFEAQVSALRAFTLMASNTANRMLARILTEVSDDLAAGVSISEALAKHPEVFSNFYVNMVKAGEETGKLNETFAHLADYLNRQYELTSKTKNALIYPVFVIVTFFVVMGLMFVVVIPKLKGIIQDSGQTPPFFTQIIIALSDFFTRYGFLVIIFLILGGVWLWRLTASEKGKIYIDKLRLALPAVGNLYRKLFLSRIADNMNTMLISGIPIVRAIDITSLVVGSKVYREILNEMSDGVKSGLSLSAALERHTEHIPPMMTQMVKVGEETGSLGTILKTLADFYKREVDDAVDTLVGLIEPVMIVVLGLGVGILLVSNLMPIYNLAGSIQ